MPEFDPKILEQVCPDWKAEHWDTFKSDQRDKWLTLRDRARSDWFFLSNDLLGYNFQPDVHSDLFAQFPQFDPNSGKHFYQLSEELKKMLILWSRGTYKSTAVIVLLICSLLNDPDLVIMIVSGSEKLAGGLLKEAKSHFERPHEKFEYLFPEYCQPRLGNASEFTLECRRDHHKRMPSVLISSAKAISSGVHPDLLLVDDLVHNGNYKKPELLEKCWEEYCLYEPTINPGGYVVVTGTRYSFGDTYERIQKKAQEEQEKLGKTIWRISRRTCWKDDDKAQGPFFTPRIITKNGQPKPIGNSVDYLEAMKRTIGDEFFACQYENNPIAGGTQTFTPELLDRQTYHFLKRPDPSFTGIVLPENGITFVVGDLAYVGGEKNDMTVFYICKLWNGQIWVFECISGRWGTEELTKKLWNEIIGVYRPAIVYVEKTPAYESYDSSFRSYAVQRGIQNYPIEWIKGSQAKGAKAARIGAVQGPLAQGRLWLFSGMGDYLLLREQLEKFPKFGKHDDHADCMGFVCIAPTGWHMSVVPQPNREPSFLRDAPDPEPVPEGSSCGGVLVC
jgi:hypothetical protein